MCVLQMVFLGLVGAIAVVCGGMAGCSELRKARERNNVTNVGGKSAGYENVKLTDTSEWGDQDDDEHYPEFEMDDMDDDYL